MSIFVEFKILTIIYRDSWFTDLRGDFERKLIIELKLSMIWLGCVLFNRFVRFVSTPEILERFVSIEKEISHIESSVQSNDLVNTHGEDQTEEGKLRFINPFENLKGKTQKNLLSFANYILLVLTKLSCARHWNLLSLVEILEHRQMHHTFRFIY